MNHINEQILTAWLELTNTINNQKMVAQLSLNETLVFRYLYLHQHEEVTATLLCQEIGMLKSQMNRTLTAMEQKQYISRVRSTKDKRQIHILLNPEMIITYQQEHQRILNIIDRFVERIGMEEATKALKSFQLIASIAKEEIK